MSLFDTKIKQQEGYHIIVACFSKLKQYHIEMFAANFNAWEVGITNPSHETCIFKLGFSKYNSN